ncbi:MAG: hypothetical protein ABI528_06975 [bacterium]
MKVIIICFLFTACSYCQNNKIISTLDFFDFERLSIVNQELTYNGFLIIEIYKNIDSLIYRIKKDVVYSDIYCIPELKEIASSKEKYIFYNEVFLFNQNDLRGKGVSLEIQNFFKRRNSQIMYDTTSCKEKTLAIHQDILSKDNFWIYNGDKYKGYFIFHISLQAATAVCDLYYPKFKYKDGQYYKIKDLGSITKANILFTMGSCIEISKVDSTELINKNFILSDWYPDYLKE